MHKTYTLGKAERLKSVVRIENLFKSGKSFVAFPFIVYYTVDSDFDKEGSQMMVSVSKRLFKHAVDRNRLKRLTREAFRLRRQRFNDLFPAHYSVAFVYKGRQMTSFEVVSQAMDAIIQKFSTILNEQ